jgi:alpha-tubulin suppressor-like RCC1 family protein
MTPLVLPSSGATKSFIVFASLGYAHSTIATETGDLVSCGFNRFGQQVCNPSVQTLPPFSSDQEASAGGSSGHSLIQLKSSFLRQQPTSL